MEQANLFVVGGPISVGKSSLVQALPYPQVPELNYDDELQMLLLKNTYEKGRVAPEVIEYFFLEQRKNKYKKHSKTLNTHVLDRSIFESLWFAKGNMDKKSYDHFKKLWESEILDLIKTRGKPKAYILLTCSWETFKNRIFNRGREVEVNNFSENEVFFKKHIAEYEEHMIEVFQKFNLNYFVINTDNLDKDQVVEKALESLKGVVNE